MKNICFYFQVHQPLRLKRYRFFDIGNDHYYYDDFSNKTILRKIANNCYLPTNKLMLELIKKYENKFKISYSISGIALEQFEKYAPEVITSFKELAKTNQVEFLAETYSHSLAALKNEKEFKRQVEKHSKRIEELFGYKPVSFRNTELVYSDRIGEVVAEMGYRTMVTEGAKHILGWKSPNYIYYNPINEKLKLLLRNHKLSDDIAFRFSNKGWEHYPLTAEKFASWLTEIPKDEEVVNLFMDYETFGEHQWEETGIFEFLKNIPAAILEKTNFLFATPSEIVKNFPPKAPIHVPYPISWADAERDVTAWLGNELQDEAFNTLYSLQEKVDMLNNKHINFDWQNLQTSDHFYYMCTKFFSDGEVHSYFNPYNSPYDAFVNYMNVLSDFITRVNDEIETKKILLPSQAGENTKTLIEKYHKIIDKLYVQLQQESKTKQTAPQKVKEEPPQKNSVIEKEKEVTKPKAEKEEKGEEKKPAKKTQKKPANTSNSKKADKENPKPAKKGRKKTDS